MAAADAVAPTACEPLCGHARLDDVLAFGPGARVWRVRDYLFDVQRMLGMLPAGAGHVLNVCEDRYAFLVGFGACVCSGRISLQPSSLAPDAVRRLLQQAPDAVGLHDGSAQAASLAEVLTLHDVRPLLADVSARPDEPVAMPQIPIERVVAKVFTSGSTGVPQPHAKTWGRLCLNARAEARRLDVLPVQDRLPVAIVGTVPSQHMYGFESVLLLTLLAGCRMWSGRPFYPADVAQALAAVPAPRMLVTTPVHLRVLCEAGMAYPAVRQLLSATAPLPLELARSAEAVFGAPLDEIYGSTETSQLATRRPTADADWHLLDGVQLECTADTAWVSGGHVEGRVALADIVEAVDARRFALVGRKSDLVNIGGRRSSLSYLNHKLAQVPGVRDGAFFLPQLPSVGAHAAVADAQRLCAVVVAPGQTAAAIVAALRPLIEPVFLPRPLLLVDAMPHNATGKLPRQALQELYERFVRRQSADADASASASADFGVAVALGTPAAGRAFADAHTAPQPLPDETSSESQSGKSDSVQPAAQSPRVGGTGQQPDAWQVPATLPLFAGHFPGHPVLPGAWLLQRGVAFWRQRCGVGTIGCRVVSAKFLLPCRPGDWLRFECVQRADAATAEVRVWRDGELAMTALLRADGARPDRPAPDATLPGAEADAPARGAAP